MKKIIKTKFFLGDKPGVELIRRIKVPKVLFDPTFTDFKSLETVDLE